MIPRLPLLAQSRNIISRAGPSCPVFVRPKSISSSAASTSTPPASESPAQANTDAAPKTHFRITLLRSAIGLPRTSSATLEALGIHRRMATVYHPHTPDIAGKILKVKELVKVENVSAEEVRTKTEQRADRAAPRGYTLVSRKGTPIVQRS
ncbi:hypothetical protein BOTBODRAFT_157533 [Botryobasidium botryosum FD-172 SS1]|uniref:Large ribosomal subunit protein uL30m n=1 Tax=Botryobasidium botryosum (strain FD-172 SS1) TaxID=930990 RepID=A0A067MM79_BOTB1|nr:hypothetical protein BOTBODRAFT_157533 [Botryobasidium botryosum FD-172 SS1]